MSRAAIFVLVLAYAAWQGGFVFYGGVVVPVGSAVLNSDVQQGFVTQRVTQWLNVAGVGCLAVWAWALRTQSINRCRLCWILWSIVLALLMAQLGLHPVMDRLLDGQHQVVLDPLWFSRLHKAYLITSTLQWIAGMALLWQTLSIRTN
jgi:hypothetical protein